MKGEKIIAALLTALLTLSPLAMAAVTLGDYPTYLFTSHNLDAYVVVGADAQPADVVGAVDLAVRLAGESYNEVSTTGSVSIAGATSEDIALGGVISASGGLDTQLKTYKLSGLQDSSVSFQDDTYDFHEEIQIGDSLTAPSYPVLETSLTASDWDMASDVYMETAKKSLTYAYVFDKDVNVSKATSDDPLEIQFMGKTLTIESVTDDTTFTVRVGDQYTLGVDQSVQVLSKTVTLKNVFSSGSVLVDVDGVSATVNSGATKTINGVKVSPIDTAYSDTKSERVAVLLIGSETTKTYTDGDPYIGQDKDDPDWVWKLASLTAKDHTLTTIAVENDFAKLSYSQDPITVGGCYEFPNAFAKVCLDSLTITDMMTTTFLADTGVDLSNAGGSASAKVLTIEATGQKEGLVTSLGSHKTGTIYLKFNASMAEPNNGGVTVYYVDTANKVQLAGSARLSGSNSVFNDVAQINYQDTKGGDMYIGVAGNNTANGYVFVQLNNTVTGMSADNITMKWYTSSGDVVQLGAVASKEDADELVYGAGTQIGTKDKDLRMKYGTVIKDPTSNGGNDQVVLEIPADQVKGKVVVYGPGGTSSTTSGNVIKQVVPVTTAVAKLDTEITDPATVGKNLVLVGGPAVNRLTAQALGLDYPTYGSSGLLPFASGEGYIKVSDGTFTAGQTVVVVAGWEAANTRMATSLLQQYTTFATELGSNTAVKVTSLTSSGITPA